MNLGGVAVLLSDLHESLTAPEFSHALITGVCAEDEVDVLDWTTEDQNIFQINTLGRAPSFLDDILTFIRIRKILKQLSPDIVHTHTSKAGVLGRLAAISLQKNISVVHTYHGHHLYGYFSKFIVKLIAIVESLIAIKTDLLIADSTQVMEDLIKVRIGNKNEWRVIPPGVRSLRITSQEEARKILKVNDMNFLVCWIGRFAEIKNPMLALTSYFEISADSRKSMSMVMVGDGDLLDACREYSEEKNLHVIFPGWQSNVDIYLAAANVLLVTSKNEGFGMVIAEAGFFSVPCISTDVGGVREFINDGVNGVLTKANPKAIANNLKKLYSDSGERNSLGLMAHETTLERFTVETFIRRHKEAYYALAK